MMSNQGAQTTHPELHGSSADFDIGQVVGGAELGGVLVRAGSSLCSELLPQRLATGAQVKAGSFIELGLPVVPFYPFLVGRVPLLK